jgi:TATA-binding protein-associated factor Taf7
VLQNLGFAPKPHPTIFIENEPDAVFDGLEKFQKTNGLDVDGAVKNKDSESGRALNAAMEEFYNPSARRQADGGTQNGQDAKQRPKNSETAQEGSEDWKLQEIIRITGEIQETKRDIAAKEEELAGTTDPILRIAIQRLINTLENRLEDLEEELEAVKSSRSA